ncbi:MAG: hypothetical protein ABEK01_03500 [Candidatus Nanohaloarchaea archaeon]
MRTDHRETDGYRRVEEVLGEPLDWERDFEGSEDGDFLYVDFYSEDDAWDDLDELAVNDNVRAVSETVGEDLYSVSIEK